MDSHPVQDAQKLSLEPNWKNEKRWSALNHRLIEARTGAPACTDSERHAIGKDNVAMLRELANLEETLEEAAAETERVRREAAAGLEAEGFDPVEL